MNRFNRPQNTHTMRSIVVIVFWMVISQISGATEPNRRDANDPGPSTQESAQLSTILLRRIISMYDPGTNIVGARRARSLLAAAPHVLNLPDWQPLIGQVRHVIHYHRVPDLPAIQIGDQLSPFPQRDPDFDTIPGDHYRNAFYDYENNNSIGLYAIRLPASTERQQAARWIIAWLNGGVDGVLSRRLGDELFVVQNMTFKALPADAPITYIIQCRGNNGFRSFYWHRVRFGEDASLIPVREANSIHEAPSFYPITASVLHPGQLGVVAGYEQYTRQEAEELKRRILSVLPPPETCRDNTHFPWPWPPGGPQNGGGGAIH